MPRSLSLFCLATLTACSSPYGNYARVTNGYNVQMADDSAHELTRLYPPAITHLALLQPAGDAYGVELVKELRGDGYAIEEGGDANNASDSTSNAPVATNNDETLPIHYTVDNINDGLYRVTISAGDHTINRVYSVNGDDMLPIGAWTRKE